MFRLNALPTLRYSLTRAWVDYEGKGLNELEHLAPVVASDGGGGRLGSLPRKWPIRETSCRSHAVGGHRVRSGRPPLYAGLEQPPQILVGDVMVVLDLGALDLRA